MSYFDTVTALPDVKIVTFDFFGFSGLTVANDLLADTQVVAAAAFANDARFLYLGTKLMDEGNVAHAGNIELYYTKKNASWGTEGTAVNASVTDSREIQEKHIITPGEWGTGLGNSKVVVLKPTQRYHVMEPFAGTDDLYATMVTRDNKTYSPFWRCWVALQRVA